MYKVYGFNGFMALWLYGFTALWLYGFHFPTTFFGLPSSDFGLQTRLYFK